MINKFQSLIDKLEKGGKPAQVGETRMYSGKEYRKMGNGEWIAVVHPEEKQLEAEQNKNKVVSLTDKLKSKIAEKKEVSHSEQHLSDLKGQAVVPGQQTRSEKPMFTSVDSAMAHGYDAKDFREVGNFYYDRAQKMADNIAKLEATKQKIDPNFEKIKKVNLQLSRQFISQANRIDDRNEKTKGAVKKSVVHMSHNDTAEVNTASFSMENHQSYWLDRMQMTMEGYNFGDEPRVIPMDKGDLYLVKVDDGMYSGVFRTIIYVEDTNDYLQDNAKVRIERMSLPSLVQFCMAKEWIHEVRNVISDIPPEHAISLQTKLETPIILEPIKVESNLDKLLRLMDKLTN